MTIFINLKYKEMKVRAELNWKNKWTHVNGPSTSEDWLRATLSNVPTF